MKSPKTPARPQPGIGWGIALVVLVAAAGAGIVVLNGGFTGITSSTPTPTPSASPIPGIPLGPLQAGCSGVEIRQCMISRTTPPAMVIDTKATYFATVTTAKGSFVFKLNSSEAPMTVNNFVVLATNHFYDGLTFHRVEGFVVQGGDPKGDGTGGPGYTLPNEKSSTPWTRASVGMAAGGAVNGSQFFILKTDSLGLSAGTYNHFGVVTSGMDVVDKIAIGDLITSITVTV